MEKSFTSIHSRPDAEIYDVPMNILIRPFPPSVDNNKVASLIETLTNPATENLVPPIDILWIKGRNGMTK
jgi:sulfiredoxin